MTEVSEVIPSMEETVHQTENENPDYLCILLLM